MNKSLITKVIYPSMVLTLLVGCAGIATSERFRSENSHPHRTGCTGSPGLADNCVLYAAGTGDGRRGGL